MCTPLFCVFIAGGVREFLFMDENVDKPVFPCYTDGSEIYYSNLKLYNYGCIKTKIKRYRIMYRVSFLFL